MTDRSWKERRRSTHLRCVPIPFIPLCLGSNRLASNETLSQYNPYFVLYRSLTKHLGNNKRSRPPARQLALHPKPPHPPTLRPHPRHLRKQRPSNPLGPRRLPPHTCSTKCRNAGDEKALGAHSHQRLQFPLRSFPRHFLCLPFLGIIFNLLSFHFRRKFNFPSCQSNGKKRKNT